MNERYLALNLSDAARQAVMARFAPRFAVVRCDHITLAYGVAADCAPPPISRVNAVAYVGDDGLEALVVEVDGKLERDDGSVYHLTLSRAESRKSVESNLLVADRTQWQTFEPMALEVAPAVNSNDSGLSA